MDIDIFIKEKCEGLSAIFLIPKFKEYLNKKDTEMFSPLHFSFINDKPDNFIFCLEKKYKPIYGYLHEIIFRIKRLDNPKDSYCSTFYKITKEKINKNEILECETLFVGNIELKKDAEKLFEMLGIL